MLRWLEPWNPEEFEPADIDPHIESVSIATMRRLLEPWNPEEHLDDENVDL